MAEGFEVPKASRYEEVLRALRKAEEGDSGLSESEIERLEADEEALRNQLSLEEREGIEAKIDAEFEKV